MNVTRTVAATLQALTLEEAKAQCRVDSTDEDALVVGYVQAATEMCEVYTGRGLLTQSYTVVVDGWFDVLWLPMAAPLQSITSVKYYAPDGTLTTLASSYYLSDTVSEPGRIMRAPNMTWPALQSDRLGCVQIVYVVGYTSAVTVPPQLKIGILLLSEHLYSNRGAVNVGNIVNEVPLGVASFWAPFQVRTRPMVRA